MKIENLNVESHYQLWDRYMENRDSFIGREKPKFFSFEFLFEPLHRSTSLKTSIIETRLAVSYSYLWRTENLTYPSDLVYALCGIFFSRNLFWQMSKAVDKAIEQKIYDSSNRNLGAGIWNALLEAKLVIPKVRQNRHRTPKHFSIEYFDYNVIDQFVN